MPGSAGRRKPVSRLEDQQAISVDDLYRRYSHWLGGALQRRLRYSGSDLDDLVHDTYLRLGRYSAAEMTRYPKALLLRIGVNLARDRLRRSSRFDSLSASAEGYEASSGADQEYLLELKRLILSLPDGLREVFLLSRYTQLTNEQIAAHLGISVKTVEWRMTKALSICASRLRD
jgi:RNA polymerase sigma factor (sigma-70 family)